MPEAGWYNAPDGSPQLRYFDGVSWTSNFAPIAAPPAPTATPPSPGPGPSSPPFAGPGPSSPPPFPGPGPAPFATPFGPPNRPSTDKMALTALILSAFGLFSFFITFGVPAVVGVILAVIALSRARSTGNRTGRPMAIIALVTGIISILMAIVIIAVAVVAVNHQSSINYKTNDYFSAVNVASTTELIAISQNALPTVSDLQSAISQASYNGSVSQINGAPVSAASASTTLMNVRFTFSDASCYVAHFPNQIGATPTVSPC